MNVTVINKFFHFVELRTKITSVGVFIFTMLYGLNYQANYPVGLLLCFFMSMLLFDMTTTAINNLIGYRQGTHHLTFSYQASLTITLIMLMAATILGVVLVFHTSIIVLLLGILCFMCGIFYTFGPLPISSLPFGELFSGIFYGLFIPLIALSFMQPAGYYLAIELIDSRLIVAFELYNLLILLLYCVAPIAATANIMLANNICDLTEDVRVGRYTLVYYIGKNKSLWLYHLIYASIYFAYFALFLIGEIDGLALLLIALSVVPATKNNKEFTKKQVKSITFVNSVKNYLWIMCSVFVGLLASYLL